MGVLDSIKGVFGGKSEIYVAPNTEVLLLAQESLKQAHEFLSRFLQEVKNFKPAIRHESLYNEVIIGKVALIRGWLGRSIIYLDGKANNTSVGAEGIKGVDHLTDMVGTWAKVIKYEKPKQPEYEFKELYTTYSHTENRYVTEEETQPESVLGILNIEMWGDARQKRGFPIPENKIALLGYLESAVKKLKEAKDNLDNYGINV